MKWYDVRLLDSINPLTLNCHFSERRQHALTPMLWFRAPGGSAVGFANARQQQISHSALKR